MSDTKMADEMVTVVKKYGDDTFAIIKTYGDDVIPYLSKCGDDALEALEKGITKDRYTTRYSISLYSSKCWIKT